MSAYLPGAASLAEQLDTRLLILLRDKRTILGTLRSFDQYLNLILEDTVERIYHQNEYCEIPLGVFLLRGDNVVVFGEWAGEESEASLSRISEAEMKEKKLNAVAEGGGGGKGEVEWDLE